MKRNQLKAIFGVAAAALMLSACGKEPVSSGEGANPTEVVVLNPAQGNGVQLGDGQPADPTETAEPTEAGDTDKPEEVPAGMYRSELTNEIISEDIKNQRPIAVMVDNESTALPHFGTSQADIVYELMNSTANNRITRLMPIVKDWAKIEQFGSIRSARPTNFMLAAEWNAMLCHDGGPFYIDEYVKRSYTNNLSGGFARFPNNKSMEYTEYITFDKYTNPQTGKSYDGLGKRIESARYNTEYKEGMTPHFFFSDTEMNLSEFHSDAFEAKEADLSQCFPHNSSRLVYNESTGKYEYYEYGKKYEDAGNGGAPLAFENVILQKTNFTRLDENGYLIYNCVIANPWDAYLLQNGEAVPITWAKYGESERTVYWYKDGTEIVLNTGKTYIALVPDDSWSKLVLK